MLSSFEVFLSLGVVPGRSIWVFVGFKAPENWVFFFDVFRVPRIRIIHFLAMLGPPFFFGKCHLMNLG